MNFDKLNLLDQASLEMASECLRTIAHPCRLRMIYVLLQQECSVGELAELCDIPSHMASEHLRLLKDRGLLASRRESRKIFYSIAEPALASIMLCVVNKFSCKKG
ncbi:MAG: metalloregulator ArsR/SmtB family transcription factor [Proteobacteria bacterium]|nr:metalloregulator ArsR/SmtB family transcription factor [Pseudomonadota bacterium]MBU1687558.1 metalloregulator ArsR/SmtB family transcription factor [Pseudomonadota bacterium]